MKQFNDITIIGIDQGYGNMKTANTIFPTAITAYDTAPMFKGDVLEYGGKFYRVGEGHKGFVADKSTYGDFYLLTLAAIAKELEQYRLFTASLCLSVGLPLSWVGSQRESFRQYLMQNETIRFRFNGNLFQLRIVGCKVYPQGYAAIVQQLADFEGEHLLADIGNGTMNLLYLTDSQPQESRCWTEKIGVNQCMIRAKEAVLRRFGSKISDSTVEQILRTGTAKIDADYLACIREVASGYVAELFAALRSYEWMTSAPLPRGTSTWPTARCSEGETVSEIRTTNLRFNLGKEPQRKAWQYLQTMDKSVFKSYNQEVATAVVDYFDRYYQTQDDPYLETRAREEQFVQQIVDAVRDTLRETMPVFLAGCITGMAQNPAAVSPQPVKEPVKDSINWDFVGG